MLKAFNPVITMVCLVVAGLEYPTEPMIASVLLTAVGTAAAAYGEVRMSIWGVVLMFMSETAESIRLVMTQFLLVGLNFHPIEGLMYLASTCFLWLMLGCALVEVPGILATGALGIVVAHPGAFLCASLMGFVVNALAYVTIKVASSLTLKVLATAKNTLLVLLGVLLFREVVTGVQGCGYAVSLSGFVWYQWIKMYQLAAPGTGKAPSTASPGSSGGGGVAGGGGAGGGSGLAMRSAGGWGGVMLGGMMGGGNGRSSGGGAPGGGSTAVLDAGEGSSLKLGVERRPMGRNVGGGGS
ncbi:hypothetical protein GPECTOR_7g936 [Gonium pectorale]|uniref:Uncharacterized protein n=1 Tax=Gonium pectorale TaxID=33097 RepID=A0A150GUD2_GONPE|nr:hypothetical protein GPECTOR_7g936 [Gonium pectorale]|eukprot:KXZ53486.1 hypothetical protein GPECTOR_7g936 [Gonium pectorale]